VSSKHSCRSRQSHCVDCNMQRQLCSAFLPIICLSSAGLSYYPRQCPESKVHPFTIMTSIRIQLCIMYLHLLKQCAFDESQDVSASVGFFLGSSGGLFEPLACLNDPVQPRRNAIFGIHFLAFVQQRIPLRS
jgi:hypothetical protein